MGSTRLPAVAQRAIGDIGNQVMVSAATVWEIEIKRSMGKLTAPVDLADALTAGAYRGLPITLAHAVSAGRLPRIHGDPFDRMLVGQAMVENLTIVTGDPKFAPYGVPVLWD